MTAPSPHMRTPAEPRERRFEGQVVFITGAARGQGRAEALRFAAEGADVIAVDICADLPTTTYPGPSPEDLAETARLVEEHDRRAVTSIADVRDFDALSEAVRRGVAELGRLDVVVANAGMTTIGPAWEIPLENWDVTIGVNLTGAYYTARAAIPIMIEQGAGGAIIFTSSVAGLRGLPLIADYVAAKHGVTGLAVAAPVGDGAADGGSREEGLQVLGHVVFVDRAAHHLPVGGDRDGLTLGDPGDDPDRRAAEAHPAVGPVHPGDRQRHASECGTVTARPPLRRTCWCRRRSGC